MLWRLVGTIEARTEVNDCRLGAVVHGLQLRNVDDATAHRRRRDEAAGDKVVQGLAVERRALLLLPAEVRSRALGAPHDAINIDGHDLLGRLDGPVDESAVHPRDTRVGHKDVQPAVELGHDLVDGPVDSVGRDHVHLVCLACANECQYATSKMWAESTYT